MKAIIDQLRGIIRPTWDGIVDVLPEHFIRIRALQPGGMPSIGILNQAYEDYSRKHFFPYLLKVDVSMNPNYLSELGLPQDAELCRAYEFEKVLKTLFEQSAPSHFLGHLIQDGHFTMWWYVRDPSKTTAYLKIAPQSFSLNFTFNYTEDPSWGRIIRYVKTEFYTPIVP